MTFTIVERRTEVKRIRADPDIYELLEIIVELAIAVYEKEPKNFKKNFETFFRKYFEKRKVAKYLIR